MSYFSRLRTLAIANFTSKSGATHAQRLNAYYQYQAAHYDEFREHLLHGREPLLAQLPVTPGARIVEFGAGTGWNAEALGDRLNLCSEYVMVDICKPLMEQAEQRIRRKGWMNVQLVQCEASEFKAKDPIDIVLCSYVLTMTPNWRDVIDHAIDLLAPHGVIGVTDFYVSGRNPPPQQRIHASFEQQFWKACFAWHHVYLSADHLPYLRDRFAARFLDEKRGRMPFMAGLRAPYYIFLGEKKAAAQGD